ncbi:MAG: FtsX-like permease family protein [Betaproteobacteria bacterium]|nr:MAG: FtsX-like permease family protein [Betaproteobacteria bacterium]
MNTLRLALRMLRRDWRAGELSVLIAALVLAAASAGTVGFFADRVKGALSRQANLLLGADLMLSADRALPSDFAREAQARGLATVLVVRFNSMVQNPGSDAVLADVKAVGTGYPLRGAVSLVAPDAAEGLPAQRVPGRGEAWIDSRLAARLALNEGARVTVGETTLTVTGIVQQDPEVVGGLLALGPRLIMNIDDVPVTNLLQPGNRASYRLLVAGRAIDAYRDWALARLERGQRLESIRDLRPEIRLTLERADKFLGLAALVAVILAAVAVALAASRYLRRHLDAAAMMRCFGAPQGQTLALFVVQFLVLGIGASVVGTLVALGGQQLLVALLGAMIHVDLPPPGWPPAAASIVTGLALLLGFALPPLVALSRVPPLRVLRRDIGLPRAGGVLAYAVGAATIAALVLWQAQDLKTGAIMIGGIAALLAAAAAAAWLLIVFLRLLPQRGYTWRYGLANLRRRPLGSSLQISALALGVMALLLLTLVRGDLMRNWRASLPPDAPNAFLINVLPDQVDGVGAVLKRELNVDAALRPMVRGRLVAINDVPFDTRRLADERARRLGEREFNLSWTDVLPRGNRVVAGQWWKPDATGAAAGASLEDGIAETLGIKLGDTLTYDIVGTRVSAKVTSLRKVDWDSFRVNFFALFAPGVLEPLPKTYVAGVRADTGNAAWLTALVREYPNVLVIDVGEILRQVQSIMDQVARAIEFVFLFTLAGGVLVLEAAIAATQDERRYDVAVLRTLGASERQLSAAQVAEFLALGALAGLLAAAGATAIGYVLADRVFQIPFGWNPALWLIGVVGAAPCIALAGWLGTRSTLRQPPLAVLREST